MDIKYIYKDILEKNSLTFNIWSMQQVDSITIALLNKLN